MKYLKSYKLFENIDVKSICENFGIENYTINSDGSIDVDGDVDLFDRNLTKIPLKFRNVSGNFRCYNNQLTTLEGAPKSVGRDFLCDNNPVYEIWKLFKDYSKIELLNDYDPLREVDGKPSVIIDRLNDFLKEIGKPPIEKVNGWVNI